MTLPTEFLRGRMGFSYLNTMDITELCATNISEYVEIAVRLGKDINFYSIPVSQKLTNNNKIKGNIFLFEEYFKFLLSNSFKVLAN